jgi:thiamine-phosphate pyrophosphorylase
MINNKLIKYIFIKNLDEKTKKNIKKFNNIKIIYNNEDFNNISLKQCIEIRNFCFKNKISLYVINNYKIAVKIKANGIFISSTNRRVNLGCSYLKKLHIIGSAHNQLEYYFKKKQNCETITLSPLFFNPKYSINKILYPVRFNLICKMWDTNLCALGGIRKNNIKKLNLIRVSSIAFQRLALE